jgi:hypothetical protein
MNEIISNEFEYDKKPLDEEEVKLYEEAKKDIEESRLISWNDYKKESNINVRF